MQANLKRINFPQKLNCSKEYPTQSPEPKTHGGKVTQTF